MHRLSGRSFRIGSAVAALLAVAVLPGALSAQRGARRAVGPDGEPLPGNRRGAGFKLFGFADQAVSAVKSPSRYLWSTCNSGELDCNFNDGYTDDPNVVPPGQPYDEFLNGFGWAWGAPPGAWAKIKATAGGASVAGALDGGWTVQYRYSTNGDDMLLPIDGQLGPILAGVGSTRDKSCRDHTGPLLGITGTVPFSVGNQLMPTSDCPPTWGTLGWEGRKPVSGDTYLAAARSNPNFAFDFWRFAEGEPNGVLDRQFGSFQTYGSFSDFSKDELCGTPTTRTYGSVIRSSPLGATCPDVAPTKPGYPLGLEVRFDVFNYGIPALQDIVFYQATIVNRSADLYGTGIDYDSLYFAIVPEPFSPIQQSLIYYRPELGAMFHTGVCAHQTAAKPCDGAQQVADLSPTKVKAPEAGAWATPFALGTGAIVILKSPMGDLRNKLFTRASSPFFGLGNPQSWGDTITFNMGHLCGFRACDKNTFSLDDNDPSFMQRQFGMLSSTELNVLGGRSVSNLGGSVSGQVLWHTFRSADWPAAPSVGSTPGDFPQTGGFNRWAPPGWDWNHDGAQDTLYFDTCSDKSGGSSLATNCVGLFSDTMPRNPSNPATLSQPYLNGYSNVSDIIGMGPIALRAGDTTSVIVAVTSGCCYTDGDSTAIMAKVNAATEHYLNFFLGPEALPKDTIVAVDVHGGNRNQASVTLRFTQTAENAADAFLVDLATKTQTAIADTTASPTKLLGLLNPFLVDSLRAIGLPFGTPFESAVNPADTLTAVGNFNTLYIFKSCDGGNTFTNNGQCTPSPATGGLFAGLGWLPYATITRGSNGDIPNEFTDPNVNGGTTYTYMVVSATRGAILNLVNGTAIDSSGGVVFCTAGCSTGVTSFAPQLFNSLASGPNVATVYVPVSLQAGGQAPMITVSTVAGPVPANRLVVTPAANAPVAGTYNVTFYDSVRVTIVDSMDVDAKKRLATRSFVAGFRGDTPVYDSATHVSNALGGVGLNGGAPVSSTTTPVVDNGTTVAQMRTTVIHFTDFTAIVSRDSEPVLVTSEIGPNATPETFFSSAAFPGFQVAFADADALAFNGDFGEQFTGPDGKLIGPLVKPYVRFASALSAPTGASEGGLYAINWEGQPFGPGEPFRVNLAARDSTVQAVQTSLANRVVADTGLVTAEAAAAIGGGTDTTDLVAVKLPFRIVNESFVDTVGGTATPRHVFVAMRKRSATLTLGNLQDTINVPVPDNVWIPSDELILLERTGGPSSPLEVTFSPFILQCPDNPGTRSTCNPVALLTTGATTWITTKPGTVERVLFNPALTTAQQFSFTVLPQRTGTQLAAACTGTGTDSTSVCADIRNDLRNVKVVPNPYVVFTNFTNPRNPAESNTARPLLFTHVPARGTLRIYTVSGQFVQQLTWTEADLNETGDLLWNLHTREGNLIAGGLYLFVITGTDANGKALGSHMGKFVVIR